MFSQQRFLVYPGALQINVSFFSLSFALRAIQYMLCDQRPILDTIFTVLLLIVL